jgi:DNA excision repair protein ERCC-4
MARLVIDTREQAPLHFSRETVRRGLPTGDYSLEGFESVLTVDRKSLDDLVQSVIHDWRRFSKVLRRMAAMDVAMIAVEAPITSLMEKRYVSDALPQSVRGKINAIFIDFGVPTVFFDNRELMAEWIENLFTLFEGKR